MKYYIYYFLLGVICFSGLSLNAQQFPSEDENIPFLITFSKSAPTSWGDDDFSQTFFFTIPKSQTKPIYVRIFDPDNGGELDEVKNGFNSKTKFSVYGGKEAFSHPDAQGHNPTGKFNSGNLLNTKTFAVNPNYDNNWYSFGPFNPTEGEYVAEMDAYVFKIICEGIEGDDGNIYKYFLSTQTDKNVPVEGANGFTYEYTFRLPNANTYCHIYPFVTQDVIAVQQYNFDWDADGVIRIVSVARKGEPVKLSGEDNWSSSLHQIYEAEKNTSLDFMIFKNKDVNNNNVVFRVTNQYGELLRFYSIPIGGKPVYKARIGVEQVRPPGK